MDVEVQRLDPQELIINQLDGSARCVQQTVNGVCYALVAACFKKKSKKVKRKI